MKWLLRICIALIALVLAVLTAWVLVAGPVTVQRILEHGTTRIDDYAKYPFRRLEADQPAPWPQGSISLPAELELRDGETYTVDEFLSANDSIAFVVIKDGQLVDERYYQDHDRQAISQAFSVSKSVISALIGAAIQDGIIKTLDQPVSGFIPELASRGYDQVTIEHLLTMTSGSNYRENDNPFGIHVILNYTPNLREEILSQRITDLPDFTFRYSSGDNAVLALLLERAIAPRTITQYTQEKLWTPLGMEQDGLWTIDEDDADALEKTWCCLSASATDLARIGQLYLQDGQWGEHRLLPAGWASRSTQSGISRYWDENYAAIGIHNYGYQWWLASVEERDFFALGKDGQFIYVNPTTQVVIVRLGWSMGEQPLSMWLSLFQAVSDATK